jgi:capsular exopolysaccharide synthesis family protein
MSRIHEALKKAAQERSVRRTEDVSREVADLSAEGLANSVKTTVHLPVEEPPRTLAGLSSSTLPRTEQFLAKCPHPAWRIDPRLSVFGPEAKSLAGAERFRTLRSRLLQISAVQPLHRILISSSLPEEGKTFVVANLAQSFARQPDRRVLMIDADMRASRLHLHFGASEGPGLSDYLRGEADETQITQVGPEGNLCLIPGGGHVANASELVHSERMKQLLEFMGKMFDWVVLDSPPALAVHDASVLADMCEGVLFVVRAGSTDYSIAERASLEFNKKNLLGVVLNRVDELETYGGYYYHGVEPQNGSGKKK